MLNFFKKQKNAVGLDLSDVSLKLMQFQIGPRGQIAVQGFSDTVLPKTVIVGDKIVDRGALAQCIRQAFASPSFGKLAGPYVNASIPETKSFIRVIQMTEMSEAEMTEAVTWEAEAYIPVPISRVYLDWLILERSGDGKMTVLITASPKDYIDDLVAVLKNAGLRPLSFEVESQATVRSLVGKNNDSVLIADINTRRTSLIIFDHGTLQFTSSLPIAGNVFTESIARGLGVSFEEAEKRKKEIGLDESEKKSSLKKYLSPSLTNLVNEIKNTIRFYEEHSGSQGKISKLILSGGSSKLRHLPSFFLEKLSNAAPGEHLLRSVPGIRVELGNPWTKVLGKGKIPPLSREDSLSFATSIGLVLREME